MIDELMNRCPNCNEEMDGYDCYTCGYCSLNLDDNEYETHEGNIVHCSEDEAFQRGYIHMCPVCGENIITWWEMEDHSNCVTCWHSDREKGLTIE